MKSRRPVFAAVVICAGAILLFSANCFGARDLHTLNPLDTYFNKPSSKSTLPAYRYQEGSRSPSGRYTRCLQDAVVQSLTRRN